MGVTPDGHYAVVGLYLEGEGAPNRIWDLKAGKEILTLDGHPEAIDGVAITPDGRRAVTGSLDATLRVWDIASGHELLRIDAFDHLARGLAVSRDGELFASAADDHTVRIWSLDTGEGIAKFTCDSNPTAVAFTPDGKTVVATNRTGDLHFLELI
jgi:WD40 repeat protein